MSDKEFLSDRRAALRESVEFFSSANKPQRERITCIDFLCNLALPFAESEVVSSADEPPDVVFRSARFEIKEILDQGRRRHDEYRAALERAESATRASDLLEQFTPEDITPAQVGELVLGELDRVGSKYPPALRRGLDALCYVNLQKHFLVPGPMPSAAAFADRGWRSVSALIGWSSFVFHSFADGPEFLVTGTFATRRSDLE
jgi:hypothetical protein